MFNHLGQPFKLIGFQDLGDLRFHQVFQGIDFFPLLRAQVDLHRGFGWH